MADGTARGDQTLGEGREQLKRSTPQSTPRRSSPKDAQRIAQHGLGAPAGPLPYLDRLQHSFGVPLGSIRAHQGDDAQHAAEQLGANAYATRGQVVLGQHSDLRTVAEETAHALRQSPHAAPFRSFVQTSGLTDPNGSP